MHFVCFLESENLFVGLINHVQVEKGVPVHCALMAA